MKKQTAFHVSINRARASSLFTGLFALAQFTSVAFANQNIVVVDNPQINPLAIEQAVAALADGDTLWFNAGTYDTAGITLTHSGVHVTGSSNATLRSTSGSPILKLTGANSKVSGLTLDLNHSARIGIEANGANFKAYDNYVHGGYHVGGNYGIYYNDGPGPAWIQNNKIRDLSAPTSGIDGETPGTARGILVKVSSLADAESIFITGNSIDSISGREGDGIQVYIDTDPSEAHIFIENNHIRDVNRRAIKVQTKNVVVRGNVHTNTLSSNELRGVAVIDALAENVEIIDNVVDASLFPAGIQSNAGNCTIANNAITAPISTSSTSAIYIKKEGLPLRNFSITGNRIKNPSRVAIRLSEGSGYLVANNVIDAGAIDGVAGIQLSSVRDSTISNNMAFSATNKITYLVELLVNSDNNTIIGNNARFPPGGDTYGAVKLGGGIGSLVKGNTSQCATFDTITGTDKFKNIVFDNVNFGARNSAGIYGDTRNGNNPDFTLDSNNAHVNANGHPD